jgi:hypothetical protein
MSTTNEFIAEAKNHEEWLLTIIHYYKLMQQ